MSLGPAGGRDAGGGSVDAGGGETDAEADAPVPMEDTGCALGATRACGPAFGICRPGTQTCAAGGIWGECIGAVGGAAAETCGNWLDDDCNGSTDEGCGCTDGDVMPCELDCVRGGQRCEGGTWSGCAELPPETSFTVVVLTGAIRDFNASHPDFEDAGGDDRGAVETMLDLEGKPVLAPGAHPTISSPDSFRQWYRDVPGVNASMPFGIPLRPSGGPDVFSYDNPDYFPIDGMLLGEMFTDYAGVSRNFHFTTELRGRIEYRGGEEFRFRGDDDVWVFVNGFLVMDLGGVHGAEEASVLFDDVAVMAGLVRGGEYEVAFFQAERHTVESNFRIDTTLGRIDTCGPI
jgi:fibro-slime domain-containing protein